MEIPVEITKAVYNAKGEKAKELADFVNEAAKKAEAEWKRLNSAHADDVRVITKTIGVVRGQAGSYKAVFRIAEVLLWTGYAFKSQKEILDSLRHEFPEVILHASIWQKELPPWAYTKIKGRVETSNVAPLNLKGCQTLSELKARIKAKAVAEDDLAQVIKPKITITSQELVIGNKTYPIIERLARGHTYPSISLTVAGKRQWLRVDVLSNFFNL